MSSKVFTVRPYIDQGLYPKRKSRLAVFVSGKMQIRERTLVRETPLVEAVFAYTQLPGEVEPVESPSELEIW